MTFVDHSAPKRPEIEPAFPSDGVPVVLCFDEAFAPYAAALLASIADVAGTTRPYDVLIFHQDISTPTRRRLSQLVEGKTRISLRFFEIDDEYIDIDLPVHLHFSRATYFRLWIPLLLKRYDKVLYIDADTVVLADLARLFDCDLSGQPIGAVLDPLMVMFRRIGFRAPKRWGRVPAGEYLHDHLGLTRPEDYFQAGVLVFDLTRIDPDTHEREIRRLLTSKAYWLADQDVLNLVFEGRAARLDLRWNVVTSGGDAGALERGLPDDRARTYRDALSDPFLVHYAGQVKPWRRPETDLAHHFWKWCRKTSWYEQLLVDACRPPVERRGRPVLYDGLARFVRQLRHALPSL